MLAWLDLVVLVGSCMVWYDLLAMRVVWLLLFVLKTWSMGLRENRMLGLLGLLLVRGRDGFLRLKSLRFRGV